MAWEINHLPQRRSEPERKAYVEGFKAGVGMARKYVAQERPLADLDLLMETLDESVVLPDQERVGGAFTAEEAMHMLGSIQGDISDNGRSIRAKLLSFLTGQEIQ